MNIIFFQNMVSPHQMPYIKQLAGMADKVILVAPVVNLTMRAGMGWNQDALLRDTSVEFRIAPSDDEVRALYEQYAGGDTWCLYSGINAFAEVAAWFRMSLGYKVRRGIVTEPPYVYDHPLWQHMIRFALKDWRYVKHIDKFFVMGDDYVWYYRMWSRRWDVIPFMYCTEWCERQQVEPKQGALRVLFVGSLSHRKNVKCLVEAVGHMKSSSAADVHLDIVGDGDERKALESLAASHGISDRVTFYGNQPMQEVPRYMEAADVLVLPSLHDGWGAVVNEALTLGLYVVCSSNCGAKYLLKDKSIGDVFASDDAQALAGILEGCVARKQELRAQTADRIAWAKGHISPRVVAEYMMKNLKA